MNVATLHTWLMDLLQQVRQTVELSLPAEALPKALWMGTVMAVIGLLLCIFGAHFARGIISVLLGGAGIMGGAAVASNAGLPPAAGGLIGLIALATVGFFAHRMWVGLAVGLLACSLGVFVYARKSFWEEWLAYQPVPARSAESEFEVPADEELNGTPYSYVRGFYDHLAETRPDVTKKVLAVAAVAMLAGFACGTWYTRGALIMATALLGTVMFTAGLGAVAEALAPPGWDGRIAQHPKVGLGFLAACFFLSTLVQYRLTQQDNSPSADEQPTE